MNVKQNDNGTITFQTRRVWHFVPEMSRGSLLDNVTNLNVPLVVRTFFFHLSGLIMINKLFTVFDLVMRPAEPALNPVDVSVEI